jgi:hypothetical protein
MIDAETKYYIITPIIGITVTIEKQRFALTRRKDTALSD